MIDVFASCRGNLRRELLRICGDIVTRAFVLVNADIGMEEEVLKQIRKVKQVNKANLVYGAYDIVVDVSANNMIELKSVIFEKIRKLEMVGSTNTMVIMDETN